MCIYTGLVNIKNPSKSVQWGSVVVLLLFNIVNGSSWIWLGMFDNIQKGTKLTFGNLQLSCMQWRSSHSNIEVKFSRARIWSFGSLAS